jgi:hypothetical protein
VQRKARKAVRLALDEVNATLTDPGASRAERVTAIRLLLKLLAMDSSANKLPPGRDGAKERRPLTVADLLAEEEARENAEN